MLSNTLAPPNKHLLSENVIASVVQRSRAHHVHTARSRGSILGQHQGKTAQGPSPASTSTSASIAVDFDLVPSPQQDAETLPYANQLRAIIGEYDRERRRQAQMRYRAKQRKLAVGNDELQQEIEKLSRIHGVLTHGVTSRDTVWCVAVEYFRVFRCGLPASREACLIAMEFLKATMAQDLDAGTVRGVKALTRSWILYTMHFQDVRLRLGRLVQASENLLAATTTTSITITRNSLTNLFPHLARQNLGRDQESKLSRVAAKLVDKRLVMHGSVHFKWDSTSSRGLSRITQADMVSPLLKLLGNLEDDSLLFQQARINPEGNLIVDEYLNTAPGYAKVVGCKRPTISNTYSL
ncbi:hypothetical protein GN244_ATG15838 [Phytophthora infestans]|uniref:Uncharacterized protein n=1 Tax=Phytophthora infestans TaxID=4787 RepID=A0A833W7Z4_PHYIN|nr:hypothetical protein GN244_ATG15838 [Phytophthora infestans]KAF4147214.1 hypothetical protein GN958_ATG03624 [Phytophthora infestans]